MRKAVHDDTRDPMNAEPDEPTSPRSTSGVQSLGRAFAILEVMADAGGIIGLSELAERADLPLATIHRLVRTLVDLGYVRQEPSRQYSLGSRLIRLADMSSKRIATWARPAMNGAVDELGESVNLAVLDGDEIVYVAQVQPSTNFMRMFTEVGRRVPAHSTGVGKALLSQLPEAEALALLRRTGMPPQTSSSMTDPQTLWRELLVIREQGWATDHDEQEDGVWCVAAPVVGAPARVGVSISGPSGRITLERVTEVAPLVVQAARRIAADLRQESAL